MQYTFTSPLVSAIYTDPKAISTVYPYAKPINAFGDFNGDGLIDIVAMMCNYELPRLQPITWKNVGNGQFVYDPTLIKNISDTTAGGTSIPGGLGISDIDQVIPFDFNKDGYTDYLLVDNGYELGADGSRLTHPYVGSPMHILFGSKSGQLTYTSGMFNGPTNLTNANASLADYNGDGYVDVLSSTWDRGAALYTNNGNGTFNYTQLQFDITAGSTFIKVNNVYQIIIGSYFNETSPPHVLAQQNGQWVMSYSLERPTIPLPPGTTVKNWGCDFMYNVDINNDGREDLMIVWETPIPGTPEIVTTFLQDSSGKLIPAHDLDIANLPGMPGGGGGNPWTLNFKDINKDGYIDIVVDTQGLPVNQLGQTVLINNGHGKFSSLNTFPQFKINTTGVNAGALNVNFFDANNDGKTDFVTQSALFTPGVTGETGVQIITWLGTLYPEELDTTLVNGTSNLDTKTFSGASSDYKVFHLPNNNWVIRGPDGNLDLAGIERLKFTDKTLATDFDGHSGQVYKIATTLFGSTDVVKVGIDITDQNNFSYDQLAIAALSYAGIHDSHTLANKLWQNIFHGVPKETDLAPYVNMAPDQLLMIAADYVGLAGVQDTGILF